MILTITDAKGEIIQQFSSPSQEGPKPSTREGMSRFLWDIQYPGATEISVAGALAGFQAQSALLAPLPPVALPGRYVVRLTVDGQAHEQPFEIRKDPRVKASDADLRAQFELMVDIRDLASEIAEAVMRLREFRGQLDGRRAELPEESRVEADKVLEQLREIEGNLIRWMGTEFHPMMWGPPGLVERLSRLSPAVIAADARPTRSMYAVFEDLSERFEVQRNRFNQITEEEVRLLRSP